MFFPLIICFFLKLLNFKKIFSYLKYTKVVRVSSKGLSFKNDDSILCITIFPYVQATKPKYETHFVFGEINITRPKKLLSFWRYILKVWPFAEVKQFNLN